MPTRPPLEKKQIEFFETLKTLIANLQRIPTLQELGDAIGCSRTRAHERLAVLEKKGYIKKIRTGHRLTNIKIIDSCPACGKS